MKKVFIDTNIVLDLLAKREPYYDSTARLFSLADEAKVRLYVNSLTVANTSYILSRLTSGLKTRSILRKFRLLVSILPVDEKIIALALDDNHFPDFEDGIQYYSALENSMEVIITRGLKGFKNSKIPLMTAEEYMRQL